MAAEIIKRWWGNPITGQSTSTDASSVYNTFSTPQGWYDITLFPTGPTQDVQRVTDPLWMINGNPVINNDVNDPGGVGGNINSLRIYFERGKWSVQGNPTARTEARWQRTPPKEGAIGFMYRDNPNTTEPLDIERILCQRHISGAVKNPCVSIRIRNGKYFLYIEATTGNFNYELTDVNYGQFDKIVFFYNLENGSNGYVHVYINDILRYSYMGSTMEYNENEGNAEGRGDQKFGFYMSKLYNFDVNGTGTAIPSEYTDWTCYFAAMTSAKKNDATFAEMYRLVSPTQNDASVESYPDDSSPLPTPEPPLSGKRIRLRFPNNQIV
jgi:hypothetical protein